MQDAVKVKCVGGDQGRAGTQDPHTKGVTSKCDHPPGSKTTAIMILIIIIAPYVPGTGYIFNYYCHFIDGETEGWRN